MTKIQDLEPLGYIVGCAHGSVQVEQDALDAAKAAADPQAVIEKVNTVTADTLQTLSNIGKLPETAAEKLELSQQIGAAALEMLTEHVNATVDFHERALQIAHDSPDVWHIEHRVGDLTGLAIYVSCKADGSGWDDDNQQMLDALADPDAFNERVYQLENPEALQAAQALSASGVELVRAPGSDAWKAEGRTFAAADLPAFLEEVEKRPPAPTTAEKVIKAVTAAPEISDATKKALTAALEPPQP